jgi:hypothetical protein
MTTHSKIIKIACRGADAVPIDKLISFQGKLKTLTEANYQRFKNEILKLGFSEPISIWFHKGEHKILNGHQRLTTLKRMRDAEGYTIPPLPISYVDAESEQEAGLKVLGLTSQYGDMTKESLGTFLIEKKIDLSGMRDNFRFIDVNMERFEIPKISSNDHDRSANTKSTTESTSDCEPDASITHAELPPDDDTGSGVEYGPDDFAKFDHVCPKCGFEFNDR